MIVVLIPDADQHSPISERGADVPPRFALGCSVQVQGRCTSGAGADSAQYVEGGSQSCYRADECPRIPSWKRLVVTLEAHEESPGSRGPLPLPYAKWYFREMRSYIAKVLSRNCNVRIKPKCASAAPVAAYGTQENYFEALLKRQIPVRSQRCSGCFRTPLIFS